MNDVNLVPESLKILLVDDEPANIMLLTKMLSVKGYDSVMSTVDSIEAISLFKEHDFDLVLLDINMPEMNGYELLDQLRQIDGSNDTRVIAISGDIYPAEVKKGMDSGFSDYITKPMKMNVLFDSIDRLFQ